MEIRQATKNDAEQLFPLMLTSQLFQKKELEGKILDEERFKAESKKQFDDWIQADDKIYSIAEDKDILGFILCFIDSDISKDASVSDLYVVPEARGKGVAHALLKNALDILKQKGMKHVSLAVHKKNPAAMKVYESAGFSPVQDDYQLMELDLGRITS